MILLFVILEGPPMPTTERVTVTLPAELVQSIDRLEKNRSRFIAEAVERELNRRREEGLRRSLDHPHPEAAELADAGLDEWAASLSEGDEGLVDMSAGRPVRWVEGEGWVEDPQ
jgi:post-segregation antitoxin (ccd killing protein)